MHFLSCLPEALEVEFARTMRRSDRRTNSLEIAIVESLVLGGTVGVVVIDPARVSDVFFVRVLQAVAASTSTLVLWTVFELSVLPAILAAGALPRAELFFHGDAGDAAALTRWASGRTRPTVRAVVWRRLAPSLAAMEPAFAHVLLGVLMGRFHEESIPALLKTHGLHTRQFERRLQRSGLCRGRSLMHLGRLMTAYKCLSARAENVRDAAGHAGYGSSRALRINAHRFIGAVPSEFLRLGAKRFGERIVAALWRSGGLVRGQSGSAVGEVTVR